MLGKLKISSDIGSITIKSNIELSGKETQKWHQKCVHDLYCLDIYLQIDDWDFTLFKQCETYKQIKEKKIFWPTNWKLFYKLDLNEKDEYLY